MRIQDQIKYHKRAAQLRADGLKELRDYIASDKFKHDTYINISDIQLRLSENTKHTIDTLYAEFGELLDY